MPTIDADIMRMDQEDMVDEIMTLRAQKKDLIRALTPLVDDNFGGYTYSDVEYARIMLAKVTK